MNDAWRSQPRHPRGTGEGGRWVEELSAQMDQALSGIRAYDSMPTRVEWDDKLHGEKTDRRTLDAIMEYKHLGYSLNAQLRGVEATERDAPFVPRFRTPAEAVQALRDAMSPLPEPIVVYRGVSESHGLIGEGIESGFLSTTTDPTMAGFFSERRVRIFVPAGVRAIGVGPGEMEVLLEPGLHYRGVRNSDGSVGVEVSRP